jgi:hypothetical protein
LDHRDPTTGHGGDDFVIAGADQASEGIGKFVVIVGNEDSHGR